MDTFSDMTGEDRSFVAIMIQNKSFLLMFVKSSFDFFVNYSAEREQKIQI